MLPRYWSRLALTALSLAVAAGVAAQAPKVRNHFDSDTPMRPPGYFDFAVLGAPTDANWKVLADYNPPSAPNQVTQTELKRPAASIAAALRRNVLIRDGRLSVGLRKGSGQGGLVLRMAGEKEFLLLLVNLETGDARLASYAGGEPTELARGRAPLDRAWNVLSVAAAGPRIVAQWDGRPLLEGKDPRPASGRVGLATAGAGAVAFDEFVIEPAEAPTP
ncbi:MAG: hypothetical protein ABR576_05420 [Thermoanaerobaculia bacterium]